MLRGSYRADTGPMQVDVGLWRAAFQQAPIVRLTA
jgi:hypothetical protein